MAGPVSGRCAHSEMSAPRALTEALAEIRSISGGFSLPELEPRLFSFNNPMGACPSCDGLGHISFFDPKRIVAHPDLSLASGAIKGWDRRNQFYFKLLILAKIASAPTSLA